MRRSCSCKLLGNRLVGVQAVKSVANRTAMPSVLRKALTGRGFRAGLGIDRARGAVACSFVDSMFYIIIFCIKGTRKGRIMVFAFANLGPLIFSLTHLLLTIMMNSTMEIQAPTNPVPEQV